MRIKFKQDKKTILKILKSSDINRKLRALDKLDGVNERSSIRILLKVLEDNSWCMREKAAYKLAGYGGRVVPRLKKLAVGSYWYVRASACLALGEIGDLKALEAFVNILLNDNNPTVLKEAMNGFVKLARKKPTDLSIRLKRMDLDDVQLLKILIMLERADIETYNMIKKKMQDE